MLKIKIPMGYVVYKATCLETLMLGGAGICDECNTPAAIGYLVPVLNRYMCPHCFKDWSNRAEYYPEDIPVEERVCKYYEANIPLTEEGGEYRD